MESRIMPPVGMGAEAHRKGPSALPGAADRGARGARGKDSRGPHPNRWPRPAGVPSPLIGW
jgi:hypothetical protein